MVQSVNRTVERSADGNRGKAEMKPIGVLVIEDQPVVREGLKTIFASSEDVRAVGEVDSGEAAVRALASRPADVVMLDTDPGGQDRLDVIPRIAAVAREAKVLVFTALHDQPRHRSALLAGARGVVTKDKTGDVILKAIRKVASGELWFERTLLEQTLSRSMSRSISRDAGLAPQHEDLTERESEIMALIGEGLRNAQIADRLRISEKTVRNHLTSIFGKVGVSDRLGLLVHAYQRGLVTIPRKTPLSLPRARTRVSP
jgi:DNA-binding NarL/FixJ family response regulator